MPTLPNHTVELLVKATSSDEARQLCTNIAGRTSGSTITPHSRGYFIVADKYRLSELDGDFYSTIKQSDSIALIRDDSQKQRRDSILKDVEEVERCLRKLLLRASDFIEDYYNLLLNPRTRQNVTEQAAIMEKSLDPITSLLTFEGMVTILGTDISWSQLPINGVEDILKLLEEVDDIQGLRQKLQDKLKAKLVWDVISESVLSKQHAWELVTGEIEKVKKLRNRAAHFQILTDKDVKSAAKLRKTLLMKIGEGNQKTEGQIHFVELPDFGEWIKQHHQQAMAIASAPSLRENLQVAIETARSLQANNIALIRQTAEEALQASVRAQKILSGDSSLTRANEALASMREQLKAIREGE